MNDKQIRTQCEREEAEYAEAIRRSNERRAEDRRWRNLERLAAIPAVLGAIGLVYWITRGWPVEQWYIAVVSVLLFVPLWTMRYGMED